MCLLAFKEFFYRRFLHVSKCSMNLGMNDPNFQVDLISLPINKVNIKVDITVPRQGHIFIPIKYFQNAHPYIY